MRVPLVDLAWQYEQIGDDVEPVLLATMRSGGFIGGPHVTAFEEAFAAASGAAHCVGVANGTDAVELALRAVGVGHGDGVVVPANTFIATVEAIVRIGARPLLVDCDDDHLIDVDQAVARMPDARAVVPVHLYGQLAPIELLRPEADRLGCAIVADAAQAQGATRNGEPIGTGVEAAPTSFYPGKNLGAFGDAGAVVTNDGAIARFIRLYSNHGSEQRYVHEVMGCNARLDALQAVVLLAKLRRLAAWNDLRRRAAAEYDRLLAEVPVARPAVAPGNEHVWHLYVIRVPERDRVLRAMHDGGIGAGVHYPSPLHLQEAWKAVGVDHGPLPNAERIAGEVLSLPLYPGISVAQQEDVVDVLTAALR